MVLDPIIDGYHLTQVLMDNGSSLNLIYQDTICKMGIDPSRISLSNTTFIGVIPGVEARCTGSLVLEVVFGSPDNFRSERAAFAHFNAIPRYTFLSLRCPVHVASSQLAEISSVPYVRKNVRRL